MFDFCFPDEADDDASLPVGPHSARLDLLAYTRSGDKGDSCNIGVIARDPAFLPYIRRQLTEQAVAQASRVTSTHHNAYIVMYLRIQYGPPALCPRLRRPGRGAALLSAWHARPQLPAGGFTRWRRHCLAQTRPAGQGLRSDPGRPRHHRITRPGGA